MSKIPFTKMHGCGNDYIYVNTMLYDIPHPADVAKKWSITVSGTYYNRHTHYSSHPDMESETFEAKAGLTYHF